MNFGNVSRDTKIGVQYPYLEGEGVKLESGGGGVAFEKLSDFGYFKNKVFSYTHSRNWVCLCNAENLIINLLHEITMSNSKTR